MNTHHRWRHTYRVHFAVVSAAVLAMVCAACDINFVEVESEFPEPPDTASGQIEVIDTLPAHMRFKLPTEEQLFE